MEEIGHVDAGGTVGGGDDGGRGRVSQAEAQHDGDDQREEDAELRRCAKEEHLGVAQQRTKVDHRADADEQQQREQLAGNACVEQGLNGFRVDKGQVDQNGAEPHGQEQGRLHFLADGQIDQHPADDDHQSLLPGEVEHVGKQVGKQLHKKHSSCAPSARQFSNGTRGCRSGVHIFYHDTISKNECQ